MGLLGRTGSGKTTLIRLLFRFYDPQQGRILLDGVDLGRCPSRDCAPVWVWSLRMCSFLKGRFGTTSPFLIPLSPTSVSWRSWGSWDSRSGSQSSPRGWTHLCKRGERASRRASRSYWPLPRAFLQDPGLVILDEPSSRLDPVTEGLLTRAIDRLLEGRTGIIVAHRLETVERVDKIMVLSQGSIVEFGDRKALAADPGSTYHAMLRVGRGSGIDEAMERMGV